MSVVIGGAGVAGIACAQRLAGKDEAIAVQALDGRPFAAMQNDA